jgi:hypothetical protein
MHPIATKCIPCLLSEKKKENCVSTCQDHQERLERNPEILSTIITDNEMWVQMYHPETKQQLSQWTKQQSSQWTSPQSLYPNKRTREVH